MNLIARNDVTDFSRNTTSCIFMECKKGNNDKKKLYFKDFLQASSEINLGANGEL